MFRRGSAFGRMALGLLLIAGCAKYVEPEESGFHSLDRESQNLAIYDTFWKHIEAHHFDASALASEEWMARRIEWREKAAAASDPFVLYMNVLGVLSQKFPHSHVGFSPPVSPSHTSEVHARDVTTSPTNALYFAGPGFNSPAIRRNRGQPWIIADVIRGSPAEKSGIAPGWILLEGQAQTIASRVQYRAEFLKLSPDLAREAERTGQVTVDGFDTGADAMAAFESMKIRLEFDLEPFSTPGEFELRKLSDNVTYLRFDRFESMELVNKVIDGIGSRSKGGLILDLRRNGGGRGIHLSRIAGALLGGNIPLGTQCDSGSEMPMKTLRLTPHFEGPLAVLIGPATSSAAEITAAAVQDHKRGRLFGRFTNGSVVVARKFDLPDGGNVMIPVSDFVRVDGRRIEGAGVEPDVWILPTLQDVRAGRDPVLERALLELAAPAS